jgi:NTP pyrophosphatase (non-canonical NTP hydrolase)
MTIKEWCDYIVVWRIKKGFDTGWNNVMEKLMLIVTEVSEAAEAYRHMLINENPVIVRKDEHYDNFVEELGDIAIRLYDLAGSLNIDLEAAVKQKMAINEAREHKHGKNC